jgi:hypothetical protein
MKTKIVIITVALIIFLTIPIVTYSQEYYIGINSGLGFSESKVLYGAGINIDLFTSESFGFGFYTGLYRIGIEWANYDIVMPFLIYFKPRITLKSNPNLTIPILFGIGINRNSIYSDLLDYSATLIGSGIHWKLSENIGLKAILTIDILPIFMTKLEIGGFFYVETYPDNSSKNDFKEKSLEINIGLYTSHFYGTPFERYAYLFSFGGQLGISYIFFNFFGLGIQASYIDFYNNNISSLYSIKANIFLETDIVNVFSIQIKGGVGILNIQGLFSEYGFILDIGLGLKYKINDLFSIYTIFGYSYNPNLIIEFKCETGLVILLL